MKTSRLTRHVAALAAALLFASPIALHAQAVGPSAKGTRQPPPKPSATSGIPAGVDTGAPGTSNSVPLGLSTTPANDAERAAMKAESAAARAAARRRGPIASAPIGAAVTGPTGPGAAGNGRPRRAAAASSPTGVDDCAAAALAAGSGARSGTAAGAAPRADKRPGCP